MQNIKRNLILTRLFWRKVAILVLASQFANSEHVQGWLRAAELMERLDNE